MTHITQELGKFGFKVNFILNGLQNYINLKKKDNFS